MHLAESQVAHLYMLGRSHTHTHSLRQKVEKISHFFLSWDIEIWYDGSLNTISEIVVIGFISTCPPDVKLIKGLILLFQPISQSVFKLCI